MELAMRDVGTEKIGTFLNHCFPYTYQHLRNFRRLSVRPGHDFVQNTKLV